MPFIQYFSTNTYTYIVDFCLGWRYVQENSYAKGYLGKHMDFTMDHRLNYEIRNNKILRLFCNYQVMPNDFVVNIGVRNDIHLVLKTNNGMCLLFF